MTRVPQGRRTGVVIALLLATPALAGDVLYVADDPPIGLGSIFRLDPPCTQLTTVVSGLSAVRDGACDAAGRIYFTHWSLSALTRWDADGSNPTPIVRPLEIRNSYAPTFDAAGNLYFHTFGPAGSTGIWLVPGADPANGFVPFLPPVGGGGLARIVEAGPHAGAMLVVEEGGVYISEPLGEPLRLLIDPSEFPTDKPPSALATDGCGDIYVTYNTNGWVSPPGGILRFDAEGNPLGPYGDPIVLVFHLEFDSAGDLWVPDPVNDRVLRILPDQTTIDGAHLERPIGIAVHREGRLPPCRPELCLAAAPDETECGTPATCVKLDASGSSLRGCGGREYAWTTDCPGGRFDDPTAEAPTLCLESRGCVLECTASLEVRADGIARACAATVRVVDTTPPEIAASDDELACLWPPNHRYACFSIADFAPRIEDACNDTEWRFAGCEVDSPSDRGDGHTGEDCVIASDGGEICLRAERPGRDPERRGRTYRLAAVATDSCGNESDPVVIGRIVVPHDHGVSRRCTEAGLGSPAQD